MPARFDPATLRPLVEPLSATAILALHQASFDHPCWTCPIESHGGLGIVWALRDRASVNVFDQAITLPVEPCVILEAACEVARAKGYDVAGWNLTTVMGIRAWLTIDVGGRGRDNICYVQTGDSGQQHRPIEIALWVLGQTDALPRAPVPERASVPDPLVLLRRDSDKPVVS